MEKKKQLFTDYNNPAWVIEKFGKPLIMQMPEAMRWPDGGGHFNYVMIYPETSQS